jgi:hypothetical protein
MAEYSNVGRVMGRRVGQFTDGSRSQNVRKNRTPEQREEDEKSTLRSYESWKADREARLARMRKFYMERQLQHKDIIV